MTKNEIELKRQLAIACYEVDGLQKHLDAIRRHGDAIQRLLETPTLAEHLDAGGDVLKYPPPRKKK